MSSDIFRVYSGIGLMVNLSIEIEDILGTNVLQIYRVVNECENNRVNSKQFCFFRSVYILVLLAAYVTLGSLLSLYGS